MSKLQNSRYSFQSLLSCLQGKPLGPGVDAQILARRTPGFSGADLSNLINEAALSAAKNNKDCITSETLDEARDKILMGSPRT